MAALSFINFLAGKLVSQISPGGVMLAANRWLPASVAVDADGNFVDQNVARDLHQGLKTTEWDGYSGYDLQPVLVNGTWLIRTQNNQETWYSTTPMKVVASAQVAYDRKRVNGQGANSFRRLNVASAQYRLDTNVNATIATAISAGASQIFDFGVKNASAASIYAKIYDKGTLPIAADTPFLMFEILAGERFYRPLHGVATQNGIQLAFTTGRTNFVAPADGALTDASLMWG